MRPRATEPPAVACESPRPVETKRFSDRWLVFALGLLAFLPYANSLTNGFVYDDDTQVLMNPFVRDLHHFRQIFTTTVWSFQGGAQGVTNYYRPLMTLTYALLHAVFGFRAFAFHLTSLGFHVGIVLMLYWATRRLFRDRTVAFLAAALFAVQPIHTEAIDWIAAVTDLETAFFFLLAFWLFLRLGDSSPRRPALIQTAMLCSFALALLAKESAATLPLLAVIFEHTCREDRRATSIGAKARRYALLWLLLAAYVVLRTRMLGAFAPVVPRADVTPDAAMLSALALIGRYVEKLVWPVQLSAAYVFPSTLAPLLPHIVAGLAILAVCVLLMVYFWRRDRRVFFGFAWFFVTLAPVLNVRWMPEFAFAERYAYLPSVGFCWIVCWLGLGLARKLAAARPARQKIAAALGCILAALMIARVAARNPDWKNDLTFYTRTLRVSPDAVIIRNDLGNYYWSRGNLAAAERQWQEGYRTSPHAIYILDNLGLLRLRQKRYGEATIFFKQALRVTSKDERAHDGLGEVDQALGKQSAAEHELLTAIKQAPLDIQARTRLGELYFDEGRYKEALTEFQAANRSLASARAYYGLGLTEWMLGNAAGGESAFKAAQRLEPASGRPHFMLGLLYGATGRTREAVAEYEAGLRIDPADDKARAARAQLQRQETRDK